MIAIGPTSPCTNQLPPRKGGLSSGVIAGYVADCKAADERARCPAQMSEVTPHYHQVETQTQTQTHTQRGSKWVLRKMARGVVKAAIGDAILTFMWVFCASTLGIATSIIATSLGVRALVYANLIITILLVAFLVFVFNIIGDALGGASFNPTGTAAFYAAGLGSDDLISMALRFPAQAIGALGGAVAILEVIPLAHKHHIGGPSLKVDLHTGAMAEGILTFFITFAVLYIVLKGPKNPLLKTLLLSIATVTLVIAGSTYTGPSMNPANAFGWAYVDNRHNTWEQFYVYWICPFVGAILAAWVFRAIFPAPAPAKQKKA